VLVTGEALKVRGSSILVENTVRVAGDCNMCGNFLEAADFLLFVSEALCLVFSVEKLC
jgi:hypothetical protein